MIATRIPDRPGWAPVTRHYQVPDGWLAVTALAFYTAAGTEVFAVNEEGIAGDLTPIGRFPHGTSHEEALEALGYTVVDELG